MKDKPQIYNEEKMLELCKEMGIEVVEGRGYSMVNGVEIDPNDIDALFDFPVYDLEQIMVDKSIKNNVDIE